MQGGGLLFIRLDHLGDEADLGLHSGGGDDACPASIGDGGAHKGAVHPVAQHRVFVQDGVGLFLHRHRLPGQGSLVDAQVDRLDQPQVGGDVVAGLQEDHIAGDQFAGRDGDAMSVSEDPRLGGSHLAQGGQGLLRPPLLDRPQDGVEDDDGQDSPCLFDLPQGEGDQSSADEDPHQKVVKLVEEDLPKTWPGPLRQFVGADLGQSSPCFLFAQPSMEVGIQPGDDVVYRKGVPGFPLVHKIGSTSVSGSS